MHKHSPPLKKIVTVRRVIYLILIFLLLYGVLPRIPAFIITAQDLRNLSLYWFVLAIGAFGATYALSAGIYSVLSGNRLPYWRTVIVQMAATFADRLLPAGSGALGVNYLFLRKQQFAPGRAIALVAANNLIGLIGHLFLLTALVLFFPGALHYSSKLDISVAQWITAAVVAIGLITAVVLVMPRVRTHFQKVATDTLGALLSYARKPAATTPSLLLAMSLTAAYTACLYAVAAALGAPLTPLEAFLTLTVGVAASTIVPTPGGLGSAEAGLAAGLVSFGITTHNALIVALLYRLITFWLALLIGAIASIYLERRRYIQLPGSERVS